MKNWWSRRHFLGTTSSLVLLSGAGAEVTTSLQPEQSGAATSDVRPNWPQQDPALVQEMVGVSHSDVKRVSELVKNQPMLANAAIDWGFGDWEDALGAASHVGRRDIAEVLLAHGARPSIFSAAMLGQLDAVKAFVAARPGIQRTHGPHGIPLMAHARAGGAEAEPVVKYLESLGDADRREPTAPLAPEDGEAILGRYVFGTGPRDYLEVDFRNKQFGITRPGSSRRFLLHAGDLTFFPTGVPSVRITFGRDAGRVARLTIAEPSGLITAIRQ
jgi:hypothetical protein